MSWIDIVVAVKVMDPVVVVRAFPFVKRRLSLEPGRTVAADDPTVQLPTVFQVPEVPAEPPVQTYWAAFAFGIFEKSAPIKTVAMRFIFFIVVTPL
jgi:hypothetical protein